ncbi:hypothetical protein CDAR_583661 [Caerostris darwini]|uniref:Uncharacterized protein n=1 Tax=Caerostris darwini TaxID=1538125 RepID=A0AAV4QUM1_9ARAC|nr:hypothetical protein CDAR_583661 [Caerostris darwini]
MATCFFPPIAAFMSHARLSQLNKLHMNMQLNMSLNKLQLNRIFCFSESSCVPSSLWNGSTRGKQRNRLHGNRFPRWRHVVPVCFSQRCPRIIRQLNRISVFVNRPVLPKNIYLCSALFPRPSWHTLCFLLRLFTCSPNVYRKGTLGEIR